MSPSRKERQREDRQTSRRIAKAQQKLDAAEAERVVAEREKDRKIAADAEKIRRQQGR